MEDFKYDTYESIDKRRKPKQFNDEIRLPPVDPPVVSGVDALGEYEGSADPGVQDEAASLFDSMQAPQYRGPAFPELKAPSARPDFSQDYVDLRTALEQLAEDKETAYGKADNRELMVRAFDAFGKVLAGMYGNKAGVDVSGIRTELPDFEKARQRIAEKYKGMSDIAKESTAFRVGEKKAQAEDARALEEFANRSALEKYKAQAGEAETRFRGDVAAYNAGLAAKARIDAAKQRATEKTGVDQAKAAAAAAKAEQARLTQLAKLGKDINSVLGEKNLSDDVKMNQVINLLQSNPTTANIPRATLEQSFQEAGWFGKSPKDAADILAESSRLLNQQITQGQSPATAPAAAPAPASGMVRVRMANGQEGQIPASKLQDFLNKYPGSQQVK